MLLLESDEGNVACVGMLYRLREEDFHHADRQFEDALGVDCYRRTVLMDLSRLQVIDSSGLAWLIRQQRRMRRQGGQLILHSPSLTVSRILSRLNLKLLFLIAGDRESARKLAKTQQAISEEWTLHLDGEKTCSY